MRNIFRLSRAGNPALPPVAKVDAPGRVASATLSLLAQDDILLIISGAIVLLALQVSGGREDFLAPLRVVLGLLYIIFIPGYCWTIPLFPQRHDLDVVTRSGISLGISLALIPILALVLDKTPWGITPWSILIVQYITIVCAICLGLWQRLRLPEKQVFVPDLSWQPGRRRVIPVLDQRLHWVMGFTTVILVVLLGYGLGTTFTARPLTEFYALGRIGLAEEYPWSAEAGADISINLGLVNNEPAVTTYRVEVRLPDLLDPASPQVLATHGPIILADAERIHWTQSWQMPVAGDDQRVDILLFRDNDSKPYRQLQLWMNVAAFNQGAE
ncbi:MAG: DUF1616 domain-containing protein [Chloroflexales bacterium]|nr:DUF1616 domain-containing protein [Chloroflexales bacterium]